MSISPIRKNSVVTRGDSSSPGHQLLLLVSSFPLSVSLSLYISHCLSLSVYLSLSLYLSLCVRACEFSVGGPLIPHEKMRAVLMLMLTAAFAAGTECALKYETLPYEKFGTAEIVYSDAYKIADKVRVEWIKLRHAVSGRKLDYLVVISVLFFPRHHFDAVG